MWVGEGQGGFNYLWNFALHCLAATFLIVVLLQINLLCKCVGQCSWFGENSPGNVEGLTVLTPKIICTGLREGGEGCERHLVVTLSTSPFLQLNLV